MKKTYMVSNPTGIHARPARKIVEAAIKFPCEIFLEKDGSQYNAKSLIKMMLISAKSGDEITVIAEGEQSESAIEAIGILLGSYH
ncbi:HPr family phosphocarrier protein [Cohnella soli]|uniref:HPr family phosphocarrier protein n=1 Tax=Cohnella soli TaxID=425005 RepID=A0ABW0I3B4_9BACL